MLIQRVYRFAQQVVVRGQTFTIGAKYTLPVLKQDALPELQRRNIPSEQVWSQRPFEGELICPVYKFQDGKFGGEVVQLEQDIWNQPLRRDLIHRLVLFTQNLYKAVTTPTLTLDRVAGSGAKMRPQKGSGQKQKPGWNKGVKAHGRKVRSLRLEMPKKVRLLALKVTLTARLYDRRVIIIDDNAISTGKTKELLSALQRLTGEDSVLLVTGYKVDQGFERSKTNIKRLQTCAPDRVNVLKLLGAKWVLITKEGLEHLTQHIIDRTVNCYTHNQVPQVGMMEKRRILGEEQAAEEKVEYDPSKPLELKFKILRDYMTQYEKLQSEHKLEPFVQAMPKLRKSKGLVNSLDGK